MSSKVIGRLAEEYNWAGDWAFADWVAPNGVKTAAKARKKAKDILCMGTPIAQS
jgi:hypothetical protein